MQITKAETSEFPALTEIWESSVRATHHFLTEENIRFLRPLVDRSMPVVELYTVRTDSGELAGFMGLSGNKIEMLFISPEHQRKGIGRKLIQYAIQLKGDIELDVNEQNRGALRFYLDCGFCVNGRSETDSLGKPFPLLHLKLTTDY
jgi:putative acetyltransferase